MKYTLLVLFAMVTMATGLTEVQKRGLIDQLSNLGVSLQSAASNLGRQLEPYIHSSLTVSTCTAVCTASATAVFAGAGILGAALCGPLCDYVLDHAEQYIG